MGLLDEFIPQSGARGKAHKAMVAEMRAKASLAKAKADALGARLLNFSAQQDADIEKTDNSIRARGAIANARAQIAAAQGGAASPPPQAPVGGAFQGPNVGGGAQGGILPDISTVGAGGPQGVQQARGAAQQGQQAGVPGTITTQQTTQGVRDIVLGGGRNILRLPTEQRTTTSRENVVSANQAAVLQQRSQQAQSAATRERINSDVNIQSEGIATQIAAGASQEDLKKEADRLTAAFGPDVAKRILTEAVGKSKTKAGEIQLEVQKHRLQQDKFGPTHEDKFGNLVQTNKNTGETDIKVQASSAAGPTEQNNLSLMREWRVQSDPFINVKRSMEVIKQAADQPSPQGDLAIIFAFMKMVDPGARITDQDFANAQNAAGVSDKVRNLWNQFLRGTRLGSPLSLDESGDPALTRQGFVDQAQGQFRVAAKNYLEREEQMTKYAEANGYDPERTKVISDFMGSTRPPPAALTKEANRKFPDDPKSAKAFITSQGFNADF